MPDSDPKSTSWLTIGRGSVSYSEADARAGGTEFLAIEAILPDLNEVLARHSHVERSTVPARSVPVTHQMEGDSRH
jgi:hypothetical protein